MQNNNTPPKLLDQVSGRIRVKHYSIHTKTQYVQWIKRIILFHGKRHPIEMGAEEVEASYRIWRWKGRYLLQRKIRHCLLCCLCIKKCC